MVKAYKKKNLPKRQLTPQEIELSLRNIERLERENQKLQFLIDERQILLNHAPALEAKWKIEVEENIEKLKADLATLQQKETLTSFEQFQKDTWEFRMKHPELYRKILLDTALRDIRSARFKIQELQQQIAENQSIITITNDQIQNGVN